MVGGFCKTAMPIIRISHRLPGCVLILRMGQWGIGNSGMDEYVAKANIDHYLSLLHGTDLTPRNRATINALMVAEEDKLARDVEHLDFAEARVAKSRERLRYFTRLRDAFAEGSADRAHADNVLANFETTHQLMEQFCQRIRAKVNSQSL